MKTLKSSLFIYILLVLFMTKCNSPDCDKPTTTSTLTDGIITGVDYRKCACCGGLMITFSNDPKPYSAEFFNIGQMPPNTGISDSSEFPIYVKLKYSKSNANCGNAIDISILEKR